MSSQSEQILRCASVLWHIGWFVLVIGVITASVVYLRLDYEETSKMPWLALIVSCFGMSAVQTVALILERYARHKRH
jgi:hypothetical protein